MFARHNRKTRNFWWQINVTRWRFRQVLPVVPRATQSVVMDTCLKRSNIWPHIHQIKLRQNMHARENEQDFSRWLLESGSGL